MYTLLLPTQTGFSGTMIISYIIYNNELQQLI